MWTILAWNMMSLFTPASLEIHTTWEIQCPPKLYASAAYIAEPEQSPGIWVYSVTSTGQLRCVNAMGKEMWAFPCGGEVTSNPTVADLDGNGISEILIASHAGDRSRLYCINTQGQLVWSLPLLSGVQWTNAVAGQFTEDPGIEVALGSSEGRIYCVNAQGQPLWIHRIPPEDIPSREGGDPPSHVTIGGHLACGDLNQDGWDDILVPTNHGFLYRLDGLGGLVWKKRLGQSTSTGPVIVPLNAPDSIGILCASSDPGELFLLQGQDGDILWRLPLEGELDSPLAVADLNQDGSLEVVLANTTGLAFCVSLEGQFLWQASLKGGSYCAPALADLNGDGFMEVIFATRSGSLCILNHTGERLLERNLPSPCLATPTVAHVAGYEGLYMVIPGRDGWLTCLAVPSKKPGRVGWSSWRPGDARCCLAPRSDTLGERNVLSPNGEIHLLCESILDSEKPSPIWVLDEYQEGFSLRLSLPDQDRSEPIATPEGRTVGKTRISRVMFQAPPEIVDIADLEAVCPQGEPLATRKVAVLSKDSLQQELVRLQQTWTSRTRREIQDMSSPRQLFDQARRHAMTLLLETIPDRLEKGETMEVIGLLRRIRSLASRSSLLEEETQRGADESWLELTEYALDPEVLILGETAILSCRFSSVGSSEAWMDALVHSKARLDLIDVYGTIRASCTTSLRPSPQHGKTWMANFELDVPLQMEKDASKPILDAPIYEGSHHLVLSIIDRLGHPLPLIQSRLQDADPFPHRCLLGHVTVCQSPVVLRSATCLRQRQTDFAFSMVRLENISSKKRSCTVRVSLASVSGREWVAGIKRFSLEPGAEQSSVIFLRPFWPQIRGEVLLRAELYDERGLLENHLENRIQIPLMDSGIIQIRRANTLRDGKTGPRLDLVLEAEGLQAKRVDVTVFAGQNRHASFPGLRPDPAGRLLETLPVTPHWGRFDVECLIHGDQKKSFLVCQSLVATCVEVRGKDLYINGEPFLLKSVNVHGLQGHSRKQTEQTLRILKEHGFNNVRADWPPLWQVRLAEEVGLSYMPLGPYSCTKTDEIERRFARLDEIHEPWNHIQLETLRFIEMFREEPNVILWNCANEVGGDIQSMLLFMFPIYQQADPYSRPVTYANLGDQGEWQGMDIVGVNLYAWHGILPSAMKSNIDSLIALGHNHDKPVIFTEFNHWWGPVHRLGADAVEHMGQYALDRGMAGTTLYKSCDVPDRHPGLLVSNEASGNLNLPMSHALRDFHADANMLWATPAPGKDRILVRNKRRFTLQRPVLLLQSLDRSLTWSSSLEDIPAGSQGEFPLNKLPRAWKAALAQGVRVCLQHESHHGLQSHFEKVVFPGMNVNIQ